MEDRDCDTRPRTSRSHHRLPKAGTFANARLPRSNSATGGLPRGRSFQHGKPQTPAAQAAQDGYYHRKAAKMYAEKRKAAAAAKENATTEEGGKPSGLINITVDDRGVKIDSANPGGKNPNPVAKTPNPVVNNANPVVKGGMGNRRNSRPRISRSSSRRGNSRNEDKENADRPKQAEIEAFFSRKRGEKDARDTPGENTSWDGSMPKRQNSRSFIERQPRPLDTQNAASVSIKDTATSKPPEKHSEQPDEHRQTSRRRGNKKGDTQKKRAEVCEEPAITTKTSVSTPAKVNDQESKQTSQEDNNAPSMSDVSETEANSATSPPLQEPVQEPETTPTTQSKDNESQSSDSYKSSLSKAPSSTSEASCSTDAGKWCDECAGIGLHIAALMSDLKKHRPLSEAGAETSAPSSTAKKGWKSMMTQTMLGGGDSKSKSSSEKIRLQNEVIVLRATVEFLYKKFEALEKGNITTSAGQ